MNARKSKEVFSIPGASLAGGLLGWRYRRVTAGLVLYILQLFLPGGVCYREVYYLCGNSALEMVDRVR
jgi:hypothetical protein